MFMMLARGAAHGKWGRGGRETVSLQHKGSSRGRFTLFVFIPPRWTREIFGDAVWKRWDWAANFSDGLSHGA